MSEIFVVTIGMNYGWTPQGEELPAACTMEIFRGGEDECRRISEAIAGAYDDRRRVTSTRVGMGTLRSWQEFLEEG